MVIYGNNVIYGNKNCVDYYDNQEATSLKHPRFVATSSH